MAYIPPARADITEFFIDWRNHYDFQCLSDEDLKLAMMAIICHIVNGCEDCTKQTVLDRIETLGVHPACLNDRMFLEAVCALLCLLGSLAYDCDDACDGIREKVNALRCLSNDERRIGLLGLLFQLAQQINNSIGNVA